jgi:hypothetical protein
MIVIVVSFIAKPFRVKNVERVGGNALAANDRALFNHIAGMMSNEFEVRI